MQALQNLLERGNQAGHRDSPGVTEPEPGSLTDLQESATQGIFGWDAHLSLAHPGEQHHWDPFRAQNLRISEAPLPPLPSA